MLCRWKTASLLPRRLEVDETIQTVAYQEQRWRVSRKSHEDLGLTTSHPAWTALHFQIWRTMLPRYREGTIPGSLQVMGFFLLRYFS